MSTSIPADVALRETAFHEAGHAVVGFALGMKFKERAITIVPTAELVGCVFFEEHLPKTRDDLCVSFAGLLAQSLTAQAPGIEERLLVDAIVDVRTAAAELFWMTSREEMLALLVNSFFPPAERGAAFYGFYNQFMQALGQSNLPQPETIEGDPVIFRELHEAAYKARTLLKDNWKLLQALGLRLLEVREMSGDELTAFLKLQTSPT